MTRDQRSNRVKSNGLSDRGGDVWVTTTLGAHAPGPKGQNRAVTTAQRFDGFGLFLKLGSTLACLVARNAPLTQRHNIRPQSMPIALKLGGAV